MNWYYEGACRRYFIAIALAFTAAKLFGHVDLIDPGMVYENMQMEMEAHERREAANREQEMRDREYRRMADEERYYRMMSEKLEKEKREQGFDYYCKKDESSTTRT